MSDMWNSFVLNLKLEMGAGKYLALVIIGMFFLWILGRYKKSQSTRHLMLFGITMTLLVIVPITGMLLMAYQTKFFDYRHLFLLLFPMVFIPWAITEALDQGVNYMKQNAEEGDLIKEKPWVVRTAGAAIAVCFLMLSGNLLTEGVEVNFTFAKDKVPASAMEVFELLEDRDVLIAPNEVIEYARAYDGDIKLIYGRDMWQPALRAYTYNTYDEETCEIYKWMQNEVVNIFLVSEEEKIEIGYERDCKAMDMIATTPCTVLAVPHEVYERMWQAMGAEGLKGFELLEETSQYAVLVRR